MERSCNVRYYRTFGNRGIRYIGISIDIDIGMDIVTSIAQILFLLYKILLWKKYKFCVQYTLIFFLALSYLARPSLCHNNSLLYDILFTRLEAFDGILEKGCLNFRKDQFSSDSKNNGFVGFRKLTIKTPTLEPF